MALSSKRPGAAKPDLSATPPEVLDSWVAGADPSTAAAPPLPAPSRSADAATGGPPPRRGRRGEASVQLGTKVAVSIAERIADIADHTGETKRAVIERAIRELPDLRDA